jgi:hypothetical protein
MRMYGWWLAGLMCCVARVAAAQLTARDTALLVDAVAARIQAQFGTGGARESFAIVAREPRAAPAERFAARVAAAVRARDTTLVAAAPTRSNRRIQLGALGLVAGDTATVALSVARCVGTPPIYTEHDASLAFRRAGGRWVFVERNTGGSGAASNGCPW